MSELPPNKFDQLAGEFFKRYQGPITGFLIGVFLLGIFGVAILFLTRQKEPIQVEDSSMELDISGNPTPSEVIFVDIAGAVNLPDVYELPEGCRLQEAIERAGGFSEEADDNYIAQNLNLAQVLEDGEKIYIPKKGEAAVNLGDENKTGQGSVAGEITGKIDINKATSSELETLPGIGSVRAKQIIEGRPYKSIEEIQKVSGIGPKTFEKLKDKITVK